MGVARAIKAPADATNARETTRGRHVNLPLVFLLVSAAFLAVALLHPTSRSTSQAGGDLDMVQQSVANPAAPVTFASTIMSDFQDPLAVVVSADGRVFVADSGHGVVKVFSAEGKPQGNIGVHTNVTPKPGELAYPVGLALDDAGRLFVSDNVGKHISVFSTENGTFQGWFGEQNGTRSFETPGGLFFAGGNLYATDLDSNRVLVFDDQGNVVRTIGAGKGSDAGQMLYPNCVWVDASGETYVSDSSNNRVQVFDAAGALLRMITGPLQLPRGIVMDASGRAYVASALDDQVEIFDAGGHQLSSFGADGADSLAYPNGLAVHDDLLYVADRGNNRIAIFQLPPQARP